ncbi:multiubiquitin domain-containing protein [Streptomyces sp. NPDC002076]
MAAAESQTETDHTKQPTFVFEVNGVEYTHDKPTITGAQIMAMAGINPAEGLVQILPDGSRITITPDETVHLVPGAQFKRRPRFKRG